MQKASKQRFIKLIFGQAGIVLVGLSYALWVKLTDIYIPCVFRTITGLKCPGCGISHMCMAILSGDIGHAWQANAFVLSLIPFLVVFVLWQDLYFVKTGALPASKTANYISIAFAASALLWGILRNVIAI